MVVKRNLTVQLDEDVIAQAKVLAAERGTSVSALVAQEIVDLTAARERFRRARDSALAMLGESRDRGGRSWTRDELYDERLGRDRT